MLVIRLSLHIHPGGAIQENEVVKIDGGQVVYTSTKSRRQRKLVMLLWLMAAGSVTGDVALGLFGQVTPLF